MDLDDKPRMADLSIAVQGISRASADFDRAASRIARSAHSPSQALSPQDTVELSSSVVDLLQARNDYAANTKTFRVLDEINWNVLNMLG